MSLILLFLASLLFLSAVLSLFFTPFTHNLPSPNNHISSSNQSSFSLKW